MGIYIIVAFSSKNLGIGNNGTIPWKIKEDLQRFKELTTGSVVIMGRKTWDSIGKKALPGRTNIVLTNNKDIGGDALFMGESDVKSYVKSYLKSSGESESGSTITNDNKDIFIIGGESVYRAYMGIAIKIYATHVFGDYECDTFFPSLNFDKYEIENVSNTMTSESGTKYMYVTYNLSSELHDEYNYLYTLENIYINGSKRPDRTGVGTISMFSPDTLRFDISKNIPLFTTKQVGFKSVLKELLWMLRGETDSKILESQGVGIWRDNTTREFLDNRGLCNYKEGWLGPLYGYNWRHFGYKYIGGDIDYNGKGYDQLEKLIEGLKKDPYSRRHMLTTYDPSVIDKCVLAPCHGIVIQFYVDGDGNDKTLSCTVYIRSNDMFLGNPYNTTSYSILTYIIAMKCGMKPKTLNLVLGDAHIYSDHVEQVCQQIKRKPYPFPVLVINKDVKDKDWKDIKVDDFEVRGYLHHPKIVGKMAV